MDRDYIAKMTLEMTSKEDLLSLLNEIKKDDLGDKCYPFELRQINYYSNPKRTRSRYTSFAIPKKSGGVRTISAPVKGLKSILIYLNLIMQSVYEPSSYANGFTKGRSVVDNALVHINQNYVLNLDMKDFFPSIKQPRVWKRLQLPPFHFNIELANIIAGLCCMKVSKENSNGQIEDDYVLPQGAPTSPLITNMICDKLDRRLGGLAKRFGLNYSRYADDITFSSMHNVYQESGEFIKELHRIIEGQNFTLNHDKTRLQKKGSRQEVTGLTVSTKVNVTRKYVREIRSLLYMWEKYGYTETHAKFYPHYKAEKGHIKKGEPHLEDVLCGKLLYLKMVKGENDATYQKLHDKYEMLLKSREDESVAFSEITYYDTKSIEEFEKEMSTTVEITNSTKGVRYAYYMMDKKKKLISITKSIEVIDKKKLQISLCANRKDRFYLIHKPLSEIKVSALQEKKQRSLDDILSDLCNSDFDLTKL